MRFTALRYINPAAAFQNAVLALSASRRDQPTLQPPPQRPIFRTDSVGALPLGGNTNVAVRSAVKSFYRTIVRRLAGAQVVTR
jgi:hypothetical protein